jgi:hypothetical protein
MQTAFTLPLQSGRLKENQGAVALARVCVPKTLSELMP